MEKFDRELQRYLLAVSIKAYPGNTSWDDYEPERVMIDDNKLLANIIYLSQHGLITVERDQTDNPFPLLQRISATAAGVDFMLNDGGLTAILNVQTIRFHRDTVTALEDIIARSNLPEPEKAGIVSKLQQLPSAAIEHLTKELVLKGALSLPAALPLIQKFLLGG